MASAPTPGVSRRAEAIDAAKQIMRITIRGETRDVAIGNLPMRIKNRVRKQCDGLPLSAFWAGEAVIDEDSLKVLWWVARMVNGENALTLQAVDDEWFVGLGADDIDVRLLGDEDEQRTDDETNDPGDDDPEL